MQVEVEKLDGLQRRMTVTLPATEIEKAYEERIKEIAKKVRMDGFRPGKAPLEIVEKRFGKTVRHEIAGELMQSSFQQAVVDQKLKIAGSPEVKAGEIIKDSDLSFEVLYESYPEVQLADFSQVTIEKCQAEITDADLDDQIKKIQLHHAQWQDITRPAQNGDRLVIDFEGFIDKKPFPGGSSQNFQLELGSEQMLADFEQGLIGAQVKENRSINVTFPNDYPITHLAGKQALFQITVHKVQEPILPELDDKLAELEGVKDKGLTGLKERTRNNLELTLKNSAHSLMKKQVLDKLVELNTVEIPQSMVNDEIKHLQDITRQQIALQQPGKKVDPAKIELPNDPYIPHAQRRVILGLLISEAIKKYEIKVDREKVRQKINELVANFPNPEEMIGLYQQNKRLMSEVETSVLEDQVVDKILEEAKIKEKGMTFHEIVALYKKQGEAA